MATLRVVMDWCYLPFGREPGRRPVSLPKDRSSRPIRPPDGCRPFLGPGSAYPRNMLSDVRSRWRSHNGWCAGLAIVTVLPALGALPTALIPALVAALAVIAAMLHWPYRSISFRTAALTSAGLSLLADVAFAGPQNLVLFWLPVELCALCGLLGRAVRVLPDRDAVVVAALSTLAVVLLPLRLVLWSPSTEHRVAVLVAFSIAFLFPAGFAAAVGLYLRSLDTRRRVAVSIARREQRLQVAHGLHDFVAHELTGIVIEAQAAQVAASDTGQVQAVMRRIETAGLRALDSMDDTLRALREPEEGDDGQSETVRLYGLNDLPELVARFGSGDGAPRTELEMPEQPPTLGREADGVGYALVLEALTNIRRHAPDSTEVTVAVVAHLDGAVELRVRSNGRAGPSRDRKDGGTGLIGLGERLSRLGGTFAAGPEPAGDGWVVRGILPV